MEVSLYCQCYSIACEKYRQRRKTHACFTQISLDSSIYSLNKKAAVAVVGKKIRMLIS